MTQNDIFNIINFTRTKKLYGILDKLNIRYKTTFIKIRSQNEENNLCIVYNFSVTNMSCEL